MAPTRVTQILEKIGYVRRRGLAAATLLRWSMRAGLKIVPFYLFLNHSRFMKRPDVDLQRVPPFEIGIIAPEDSHAFSGFRNLTGFTEDAAKLWEKGCTCVCLKNGCDVLAYGWFDLVRCNYPYLSFELHKDEAYIFNFWTLKSLRGRDAAALIRLALCAHLCQIGRHKYFSITEKFNTPAMRLREKFGSQVIGCYLYLELFGTVKRNLVIRKKSCWNMNRT